MSPEWPAPRVWRLIRGKSPVSHSVGITGGIPTVFLDQELRQQFAGKPLELEEARKALLNSQSSAQSPLREENQG